VRRIRGGESVLTQYGYCYSMTTRKATCALHAGYCQGDEKHYPSRTSTQPFDCPCHKVKVGACKRTKVCEMKCSASTRTYEAAGKACTTAADCAGETGKTACARGPCSVDARADGTIRCVVDADSCDGDEEYKASRSDDAADCTLCDEPATAVEPQATTPSPSVPIYTHQVKMSVSLMLLLIDSFYQCSEVGWSEPVKKPYRLNCRTPRLISTPLSKIRSRRQ